VESEPTEKDDSSDAESTEEDDKRETISEYSDDDSSDAESTEKDYKRETISEYSDCVEEEEPEQPIETQSNLPRRSTRVPKPVNRDDFHLYLTKESTTEIPETVEEALASPDNKHWIKAMEEEYRSLPKENRKVKITSN